MLFVACGAEESQSGSEGEIAASPLAEYLGQVDYLVADDASLEEQQRQAEAEIEDCMAEQGFEYIPAGAVATAESIQDMDPNSREYAETYGFGVSTESFSQDQVGPDLLGYEVRYSVAEDPTNTNEAMLEAMPEEERQAWSTALYGDTSLLVDDTLTAEELEAELADFEPSGGAGEAYGSDNRFYLEFGDELEELDQRIRADLRMEELFQSVTTCVAEEGLEADPEGNYESAFYDRLAEIDSGQWVEPSDLGLTEEDLEEMSPEEINQLPAPELSSSDKELLAEIQADEVELAVAVFDCGGGPGDWLELYSEVRVEYEQEFIDDNADRLEDFKDAD
jgi:hypothetical protein